jgi:hypothetical protein
MPSRPGALQTPPELGVIRARPMLDCRLNTVVKLFSEQLGVVGAIAMDEVVRAGLEQCGMGDLVEKALAVQLTDSREDQARLEATLREHMRQLEEVPMAS